MKEKKQGYTVLKEVTPGTFHCFLEWIYQGFYSVPHLKMAEASLPTPPDNSDAEGTRETKIDPIETPPAEVKGLHFDEDENDRSMYDEYGFSSTKKGKYTHAKMTLLCRKD